MSDAMLIFRGEVALSGEDEIIVDAPATSSTVTRLAISGGLRHATLHIARLATRHTEASELASAVDRELPLEQGIASSLIEQLVAAGVLSSEVNATTRLRFCGHSEIVADLRAHLHDSPWPSELPAVEVAVLGTLGSTRWYRELELARARDARLLTCSFEGQSAWIGPFLDPRAKGAGACPLCLQARRVAAGADDRTEVTLSCPPNLALVAQTIRQVAELSSRGELPEGRVLHVAGASATWRTLPPQPHCTVCDASERNSFRTLSTQAADYANTLKIELDKPDTTDEPCEQQRQTYLDPVLGPLRLEVHDAADTFRELPLVLGSIRTAQRSQQGFIRREFASVMFGTGATERRRLLVAYSEGIERYAGVTDEPDITATPYRELAAYALAPEETVRFSDEQYASGVCVRHTDQPLDWSWVYDWTNETSKLLIRDAVSYGQNPLRKGVRLFDDPFSSGMSAHRTATLALERSLFELIERDAFVAAWYLRLGLRELDLSRVADAELRDLIAYLQTGGVTLRFYDLRVDFSVPTVLAVAEAQQNLGPWRAGGKVLSACAGKTWREAARHAVREVLGHYTVFAIVSPEGDKSIDPETGQVRPWWPAFAALLQPRADDPLGFLGRGPSLQVNETASIDHQTLRSELTQRGLSVFVRQLGRRAVSGSGLVAIRAIVPGLLRLTPTRESVNFGEPRLGQLRARWSAQAELNPLAHPLA